MKQVEIEGARRLRATLKKAGHDLSDLKEANRRAAFTVAQHSKSAAPQRTGKLRSTIRSTGTAAAGTVRAGFKKVPYAGPIHWGWPKHGIEARPFISYTAQVTEPIWIENYIADMHSAIAKIQGK